MLIYDKLLSEQRLMKKLPGFLEKYFWDIEFKKINQKAYPLDVLARLLEYGDEEAIGWMKKNFTRRQITDVNQSNRRGLTDAV